MLTCGYFERRLGKRPFPPVGLDAGVPFPGRIEPVSIGFE
jgi:hypothetical protein